ncbi:MAG: MoaD/ThiS family protein [Sphaerochaetaceae bacterium]
MAVEVRFFIPIGQLMGKSEKYHVEKGTILKEILEEIAKKYPAFDYLSSEEKYLFLINGLVANLESRIVENDVLTLLQPMIGG